MRACTQALKAQVRARVLVQVRAQVCAQIRTIARIHVQVSANVHYNERLKNTPRRSTKRCETLVQKLDTNVIHAVLLQDYCCMR